MTDDQEIKVLVVEDQQLIRKAFASMLRMEPDIRVVGEAADGSEAVRQVQAWKPDVVLMDLQMPRMGGIQATRRIREDFPQTRVIVLTTFDQDDMVFEAIAAGADAYLLKDASETDILATIRGLKLGESRLEPHIARKVLEQFRRNHVSAGEQSGPIEALTDKEEKVLALVAQGKNNKEIAATLFLAEGTVKNYVSRIMEKFQANSRTELAVKALQRHRTG